MALNQMVPVRLTEQLVETAILNKQLSKQFIKRLIPITVASIVYRRIGLNKDDDDFCVREFKGIEYRTLNRSIRNNDLAGLRRSINGIVDAFEKEVLKCVYLMFKSTESNKENEVYRINFKYFENAATEIKNGDDLKRKLIERTIGLFKSIQFLQLKKNFSRDNCQLKIFLTYYDNTLSNYISDNFQRIDVDADEDLQQIIGKENVQTIPLSVLKTGYNTLKCSYSIEVEEVVNDENRMENELTDPSQSTTNISNSSDEVVPMNSLELSNGVASMEFKCLCNVLCNISAIDAVRCKKCLAFQHCVCLGYLMQKDVSDDYSCFECNGEVLSPTVKKSKEKMNVLRLAVVFIHALKSFPDVIFSNLSSEMKEYLRSELLRLHIIQIAGDSINIHMAYVKPALLEYFHLKVDGPKKRKFYIESSDSMEKFVDNRKLRLNI